MGREQAWKAHRACVCVWCVCVCVCSLCALSLCVPVCVCVCVCVPRDAYSGGRLRTRWDGDGRRRMARMSTPSIPPGSVYDFK